MLFSTIVPALFFRENVDLGPSCVIHSLNINILDREAFKQMVICLVWVNVMLKAICRALWTKQIFVHQKELCALV